MQYKLNFFSQLEDANKSPHYIANTYSDQYRFDIVCTYTKENKTLKVYEIKKNTLLN